jgi:hypothetical protein
MEEEKITDSTFGEWLHENLDDPYNDYYLLHGLKEIIGDMDNNNINKKFLKRKLRELQTMKSSGAKLFREEMAYAKRMEKNQYKNNI